MQEIYILLAGLAISFVSMVILLNKRPSEVQKWYLTASSAIFVYMAANFIKRHSGEIDTYVYLQSAIYVSTAVINGGFLFGTAALEIRSGRVVRSIFAGFIISSCLLMMTIHLHDAFYSDVSLAPNPAAPGLFSASTKKNWLYFDYTHFYQLVKIVVTLYLMFRFLRKKGNKIRLFRLLALALLTPVLVDRLDIFDFLPSAITNHCSFIAANIIMLILIQYYEVTMTMQVIKEQAIERSPDGIVIMDRYRRFKYANDTAKTLFPMLASEKPDDASAFIANELQTETTARGEREYEIRTDEEKDAAGRTSGYLTIIHDVTERELAKRQEQELIAKDMNLAARIQSGVLPSVFPAFPDRNEFEIYAFMEPAREVGGDFYDFFLVDENHLGLVIADVSGKGIPAALFMMVAKAMLRNQLMTGCSPAQALERVNVQLSENNPSRMFVTVWLAVLEISTGKGRACNAGHEHPCLRRRGGKFEVLRYNHDMIAGFIGNTRYHNREFELSPGDSIFVYTDGVPEACNAAGEMFTEETMVSSLNREPEAGPEKLIRRVREDVAGFAGGAPQFDDITMLCLEYYGTQNVE